MPIGTDSFRLKRSQCLQPPSSQSMGARSGACLSTRPICVPRCGHRAAVPPLLRQSGWSAATSGRAGEPPGGQKRPGHGRPPLPVGTNVHVHVRVLGKGRVQARAPFRDFDGRRRLVARYGRQTRAEAERRLREALRDRSGTTASPVSADARRTVMAQPWLATSTRPRSLSAPNACTGSPPSPTYCPRSATCAYARSPSRWSSDCWPPCAATAAPPSRPATCSRASSARPFTTVGYPAWSSSCWARPAHRGGLRPPAPRRRSAGRHVSEDRSQRADHRPSTADARHGQPPSRLSHPAQPLTSPRWRESLSSVRRRSWN
jgi:hypothetical protein